MQLVKFDGHEGTIYVNPVHVVSVKKALKDTRIETLASAFTVKEAPEVVARMLGVEVAIDVTPQIEMKRG
ncbi:hypothetical protein [Devosia sp.]|uniref:hypothetical protein n=1 Tax=Devosia sp. TaxID=1871048 RepID=UPI003BA949D8